MARFEMAAALFPSKIAVDGGNVRLTYSQLRCVVLHRANRIKKSDATGVIATSFPLLERSSQLL